LTVSERHSAYRQQAAFYRGALLLGLIRGDRVIAWADRALADDAAAPAELIEVATTPPDDLTLLRERLLLLAPEREPPEVVSALLGFIQGDLASARRTFADTMTVLRQLRAFMKIDRALNEKLKELGVDLALTAPGSAERAAAEQRVREWLASYEEAGRPFRPTA
jgi:hypothetical protein